MDKSDLIFLEACRKVMTEDQFNDFVEEFNDFVEELTERARRETITQKLIIQLLEKRLADLKEEVNLYRLLSEELHNRIEERDNKNKGLKWVK